MIAREDMIVQSAQDHLREGLFTTVGYPPSKVELVDGFDARLFDEKFGDGGLDKSYIAAAYQFDDGGRQAELGSALTRYLHTVDFLVLGWTATWGRNLAQVTKAILSTDEGSLPLRDYGTVGKPIIDRLEIEEVSAQREFTFEPRPWNTFAWTVRLRLLDYVYATG